MVDTVSSHDGGQVCICVSNHVPGPQELHKHHIVPLYAGGPDTPENIEWICPTTHANVHELIRAWEKAAGEPVWAIRKHFNSYVRELARRGYEER